MSPIEEHMPGWGLLPIAPMFIIPKTEEKCFCIFNCKFGHKALDGPNAPMRLPNLYTLKDKFLSCAVETQGALKNNF